MMETNDAALALDHEPFASKRGEVVVDAVGAPGPEVAHRPTFELASDDSAPLQERQLFCVQPVEPAGEQGGERRRRGLRVSALARVREQLLDEQRISAGRAQD